MANDHKSDTEAEEFGVDVERIRYNLTLTVEERLENHRRAWENVLLLREAGKRLREVDGTTTDIDHPTDEP